MASRSDLELLRQWRSAFDEPAPPGWDLAEFRGRVEESEPSWSFAALARAALAYDAERGDALPYPEVTLRHLQREAEQAGFEVERAEEWEGPIRFADVGTLVSYCRLMPWQLPAGFSVDRYARELLSLHHAGVPPVFTERRLVLLCRKPLAG